MNSGGGLIVIPAKAGMTFTELQFWAVLRIDPEQGDVAYSPGLLLAELNRLDEAGEQLWHRFVILPIYLPTIRVNNE